MKYIKPIAFLFLHIYALNQLNAQADSALVYGELGKDYNRPVRMIKLPGGNLIWAGEWNDDAVIMKISPAGKEIKRLIFSYVSGSVLKSRDLILDNDNTLVIAGECTKCVSADSLPRITLFRIDTSLNMVQNKILLHGMSKSNPFIYNPSLARNKNTLMLIASQGAEGLNFEDTYLAAINEKLDTLWTKSINSCSSCGFEYPVRMTTTSTGFAAFAYHAFTDSATLFHFNDKGDLLWKQRSYTFNGVVGGAISYFNGKIYIGVGVRGLPSDPFFYVATILTYDEKTGTALGATSLSDAFTDRTITSLEFAKNGYLLVGYRRVIQSFTGSVLASQVLRLDLVSGSPKFIDLLQIPNPTDITNMGVVYALPLNDDGSKIGAIGIRGFFNRTFYFTNPATTVPTKDINPDHTFSVFPNPAREFQSLIIKLNEKWKPSQPINIEIYSLNGQLIKKIRTNEKISPISISGLGRGHYTVVLKSGGSLVSKMLLVE